MPPSVCTAWSAAWKPASAHSHLAMFAPSPTELAGNPLSYCQVASRRISSAALSRL